MWWLGWVAGVSLAKATDLRDERYGLGEALGMILLVVCGLLLAVAAECAKAAARRSAL
jgi:hypothetical protein